MTRKSRVGFVIIKIRVGGIPYYLMRINTKWKDLNFIGGHEKDRDGSDLAKTARRELWEEVPSVRPYSRFHLETLTSEIDYGPIYSRSKGDQVEYNAQFFLLQIDSSPANLIELLSSKTRNIWVSEQELLRPEKYRISGLVKLLDQIIVGGLASVPFSSPTDMAPLRQFFERSDGKQLEFALK